MKDNTDYKLYIQLADDWYLVNPTVDNVSANQVIVSNGYEYTTTDDNDEEITVTVPAQTLVDYISNHNTEVNSRVSAINTVLSAKANNSDLTNKANSTDAYLTTDTLNYLNSLNLSNIFPESDVTTLPNDKTALNWLFNALLVLIDSKADQSSVTNLQNLQTVRYYYQDKESLPEQGSVTGLYFVLNDANSSENKYKEYIWDAQNNRYELVGVGDYEVDMANIYTKTQVDNLINEKVGDLQDYFNT